MMKANHHRTILIVLFFGSLLAIWGLDLSGVRRQTEVDRRADRVLPDLIDLPEAEIRRVAIDRGEEHLVFERRGEGLGRWQMIEPKDVAAEPVRLDALVRNLKELRKDPDAGTITRNDPVYGLSAGTTAKEFVEAATIGAGYAGFLSLTPPATVRLYAGTAGSASADRPVAELELGRSAHGHRYVRPVGGEGIEVVDARLLSAVDLPVVEWRQPNVLAVPSFQIGSVRIVRRDQPDGRARIIEARRGPSGKWTVEVPTESTAEAPKRGPLEVPANGPRVESLLGALSSLRVAEPPKGYVADDVKDMAPYGLGTDRAAIRIELKSDRGAPMVLEIGKPVPDDPERVYLRQGDQDDVVMVEARALAEIPADVTALRSQQLAEIVPAAVTEFEIATVRDTFRLRKEHGIWELTSPRKERADAQAVHEFLTHVQDLQTSEFLEPGKVPNPMLDPPVMRIKIRQAKAPGGRPAAKPAEEESALALDLRTGNHDIARKTVYAQLEGDRMVLALPDKLIDFLPKNPLAFRDRGVITDGPDKIKRLTIRRGRRIDELVPDSKGEPNAWRMLRPVEARADTPTITQVLAMLCSLRAQDFSAPSVAEAPFAGLDQPLMEIDWESDRPHFLKIGAPVQRGSGFYATCDGEPMVFTLPTETVKALDAEYHDHRVMSFPPARARRVVLHFFGRTLALKHRAPEKRGQVEWVPESGSDATGIDLSRIASLVQTMGQLQTRRFIQYEGELPYDTGLSRPRLTVEVAVGGEAGADRVLRIGENAGDGTVCAALGTGSSGPAFLLPGPPWNELIRTAERLPTLPDDVFAPSSGR